MSPPAGAPWWADLVARNWLPEWTPPGVSSSQFELTFRMPEMATRKRALRRSTVAERAILFFCAACSEEAPWVPCM